MHFRKLVDEVTLLLTYEATKDLPTEQVEIETPLERAPFPRISGKKVAVCPILRAGLGMLDGVLTLISGARVGFIGLYRDEETLQPVEYYVKLPQDVADRDVILLDPMLATGNSTAARRQARQGRRRVERAPDLDHRRARRDREHPGDAPRRADRRRGDRPPAERARLHRSRASATRETASTARSRLRRWSGESSRTTSRSSGARSRRSAIVLLLTPAVGRAARLPAPRRPAAGGRPRDRHEIPRLGGLALFLGILVPSLAFLPLGGEMRGILLGACVATTVGAVDDFRGLHWWQKLGGQSARRRDPDDLRRLGAALHVPDRRHPRAAGVGRHAADDRRDRRA